MMFFFVITSMIVVSPMLGLEEPSGAQCMSRFDYDFKMMQKIISLETKFEYIETKFDEYFGLVYRNRSKGCPNGWVTYEGSCYLFGTSTVTFTVAEDYCRHRNSRLVHVETNEENLFLKGYITDQLKGGTYWLGMTDEITEGLWRWYGTDEHVRFFDWGPGEPSLPEEDCAAFHQPFNEKWIDVSCLSNIKAICEQKEVN